MELYQIVIEECDADTYALMRGYATPRYRDENQRRLLADSLRRKQGSEYLGFGRITTPWTADSFRELTDEIRDNPRIKKIKYKVSDTEWTSIEFADIEERLGRIRKAAEEFGVLQLDFYDDGSCFHELVFYQGEKGVVSEFIKASGQNIKRHQWNGGVYKKVECLWVPDSYLEEMSKESASE